MIFAVYWFIGNIKYSYCCIFFVTLKSLALYGEGIMHNDCSDGEESRDSFVSVDVPTLLMTFLLIFPPFFFVCWSLLSLKTPTIL